MPNFLAWSLITQKCAIISLQEQRSLEKRYEELISQRATLKGLANKSKYKANQQELGEVSRMLRESTKNLCRTLKVIFFGLHRFTALVLFLSSRTWHTWNCHAWWHLLTLHALSGQPKCWRQFAENPARTDRAWRTIARLFRWTWEELCLFKDCWDGIYPTAAFQSVHYKTQLFEPLMYWSPSLRHQHQWDTHDHFAHFS